MKKYFFYSIIIIFYSCEKVINIDSDYSDERIVLDASIFKNINEDFATATVMVSKTAPYFDENNTLTAEAEVYVKTKNGNINLIYNSEKKYYTNKISYINYEEDYEFFVRSENQNYYSSEKLIKVSGIESVVFGDRKSLNKDEIELLITFTDPKEIVDFNLWKFGPKGNDNNYDYLLSRDLYTNGNQFTFSFFIDKTKYFKNNEFVYVEMSGLTEEGFNYLNILTAQAGAQNGRPFSSASSIIKGNIINQSNPEKFPLGYYRVSEFDYFRLSKEDAPDGVFD
ncbi:DUF4249 domain-containing protein [Flavobacteriaceae bacterium]|nr:DUF4249 domain-containing protein [Flavobacteriaceae bacterium]MDA9978104.1 DUF4249 domain-containing protein [Flavobacteriaceae bacterium]MDB4024408.1 DUF4249 domain-containing protein [Flavobacteriaceae bacterium]MDB4131554.1 DUF4249 domain-containing protein [Flavobacteriaceae bacterium]MDC0593118.1 DUF4249 domain-containing protein [Flavobacteriaceae bacterium]